MNEVGKEYGAALFALAEEEAREDAFAEELNLIKKLFCENPEYPEYLASPAVPKGERIEAIEAAFAGRVSQDVLSFLVLLCKKNRIPDFFRAEEEFRALLDEKARISHAKITGAAPLSDEERAALIAGLEKKTGRKIQANFFVDETLLGGVTVEMDGAVLDGSLRHRLYELKEVVKE